MTSKKPRDHRQIQRNCDSSAIKRWRAVLPARYTVEPLESRLLLSSINILAPLNNAAVGRGPTGLVLSGSTLYGMMDLGGADGDGTVYSLPAGGGAPSVLVSFNGTNGEFPSGGLIVSGSTLYGTTAGGEVFSLPTTGGAPTILASLIAVTDSSSVSRLTLSGGILYGTTGNGGLDEDGTVFAVPAAGGTPSVLASLASLSFDPADLAPLVNGDLALSGSTLYGTTYDGQADGNGEIFSVPITGGTPTVVASLDGSTYDGLTISGGTLYGTDIGGADGDGEVFSVPATGGTPTVLASFNGTDGDAGYEPLGGLVFSGNTLYGTTEEGGPSGFGEVFSVPMTGGTPTVLASFNLYNGITPRGGLVLSGSTLYGTTDEGGTSDEREAFSVSTSGGPTPEAQHLAFAQQPSGVVASGTITPAVTVDVDDNGNNIVPMNSSYVTLSIASGPAGATLGGTTGIAAVNGVATFTDLQLSVPGTYTLTASCGFLKNAPTSQSFQIGNQVVPTHLAISTQPQNTVAGSGLPVVVDIEDQNGDVVTTDDSEVTLSIATGPTGAALIGTASLAAVNGVATFSGLTITIPGDNYTLTAADGALSSATSTPFNITATPTNQLAFVESPASTTTRGTLGPITVDVDDPAGVLLTTDNSDVTLTLAGGSNGATLGGDATVVAVNGVATFGNLSIATAGNNYTLTASDGAFSPVTSGPFNVTTAMPPSPLVPTLDIVSLPPAVVAGTKLKARVPVLITNSGSNFKGNVTVKIFADTGTSFDGNQVLVTTLTKTLSLKSGKGKAVNFSIMSFPQTLPNGTYHLLAELIDPSNLTNVTATTQTIQVAAAFIMPAVTVGTVVPASIAPGKSGSILITVTNKGNVPASGMNITLSPSTDGLTPVAGVILLTIHSGATIQPGKSKTFRLHFKVTTAATAGVYFPYLSVSLGGIAATMVGSAQFTAG